MFSIILVTILYDVIFLVIMFVIILVIIVVLQPILQNYIMKSISDSKVIETSRKYGLDPGGLKCKTFALFDQGYSTIEVGFLLRKYQNLQTPRSYRATVRKYHSLWEKEQRA